MFQKSTVILKNSRKRGQKVVVVIVEVVSEVFHSNVFVEK